MAIHLLRSLNLSAAPAGGSDPAVCPSTSPQGGHARQHVCTLSCMPQQNMHVSKFACIYSTNVHRKHASI
jgi:hypothetical protein